MGNFLYSDNDKILIIEFNIDSSISFLNFSLIIGFNKNNSVTSSSSPNLFKKVLYSRLTTWSSGNKFASVVENLMFAHCVDNPKVITAMRIRRKVLFLKINRASALQNPILKSLFTLNNYNE